MKSGNSIVQNLAGGAFPVIAATVAFEIGKSMKKSQNGEITTTECFEEIKGKSVTLIGSSIGASFGSALISGFSFGALGGIAWRSYMKKKSKIALDNAHSAYAQADLAQRKLSVFFLQILNKEIDWSN